MTKIPEKKHHLINFFKKACEDGQLDIIEQLFSHPDYKEKLSDQISHGFKLACAYNQLHVVQFLFDTPDVQQYLKLPDNLDALGMVSQMGHIDIVKFLIHRAEEAGFFYPNIDNAIMNALNNGHLEVIKVLLSAGDTDTYTVEGLSKACKAGHMNIVEHLLTTPGLKEHVMLGDALSIAVRKQNLPIMMYLLKHCEFHPAEISDAIAACRDNKAFIEPLLQYGDIKMNVTKLLNEASTNNRFELVQWVLNDPLLSKHVNVHIYDDHLLIHACKFGAIETIHHLLTSDKDKHYEFIDEAFAEAMKYNKADTVYYLLHSPQFQAQTHKNNNASEALLWVVEGYYADTIKKFLDSSLTINLHIKYDAIFQNLYSRGNTDIIHTLIFEHNLQLTPIIEEFLQTKDDNMKDDILKSFRVRESCQSLSEALNTGKVNKKLKI